MALNLIILGPPGAGKGTQAEQIARTRGIPKISTGDILRDAVLKQTEIGLDANAIMARGELVKDEVVIGIVRERLEQPDFDDGFVLDGFPRTVAQARALDELMTNRGPLTILEIVVPDTELVRRLSVRMVCEGCGATAGGFEGRDATTCRRCGGRLVQRSDDNDAVVLERLRVYHSRTKPLVEYYQTRPTFRSVNGSQSPERVSVDLMTAIDSAASGVPVKGARS